MDNTLYTQTESCSDRKGPYDLCFARCESSPYIILDPENPLYLNPLPNNKILDLFKLKALAYDK